MKVPSEAEILVLLDQLEDMPADSLESEVLDSNLGTTPTSKKVAVEYAACMASAKGGVIGVRGQRQCARPSRGKDSAAMIPTIGESPPRLDNCKHRSRTERTRGFRGSGGLLVVRGLRGTHPPYGTSSGMLKQRVGKNCMPMDPHAFQHTAASRPHARPNVAFGPVGRIRTQDRLGLSVRYRFDIANVATIAILATDHCTLLHAATGWNQKWLIVRIDCRAVVGQTPALFNISVRD